MTLLEGLSAANSAIKLLRELREIDKSVDEATFKLKIADISEALADARIALSEANLALQARDQQIDDLQQQLDVAFNGEFCPKCQSGRMKLLEIKPAKGGMDRFGVEEWYYQCQEADCMLEQKVMHDPHGVIAQRAGAK